MQLVTWQFAWGESGSLRASYVHHYKRSGFVDAEELE